MLSKKSNVLATDEADLSIVIPNYNHGNTVANAVRAAAAQRPRPREILVIDDGSTDNSRDVLEALAQQEPRLRVIYLAQNGGVVGANNTGLQEARSRFVNFGAADDVMRPGLVAAAIPLLERAPDIAFASGEAMVVDIETGSQSMRPPVLPSYTSALFDPDHVMGLFRRADNWILPGTAIFRRDMLLQAGGFDPALASFADGYVVRHLAFAHGCAFFRHCGVEWRVVSSGLSRSVAQNPVQSEALLEAVLERMKADPVFPAAYLDLFAQRWRFACARLRVSDQGSVLKVLSLVFLTIKYRPVSMMGLFKTIVHRKLRPMV
ncbi:glycosyltransferase family 2 protein [Roseobacter sp.]|uniref:glycosyltransferase family 2 protein n=1 Tax=Roseobacter sp. TaxID=1907202 RepID=UPI00329935DF